VADILIHRCTLRVVRRGGWSWGPDPKRLMQEVVRILPVLLAQKLAELLASSEDAEFAAPLRVRLPLRLNELIGESTASRVSEAAPSPQVSSALEQRVEFALRAALGLHAPLQSAEPETKKSSKLNSRLATKTSQQIPGQGGALERLLLTWHAEGGLTRRLTLLPLSEIELWHAALQDESRQPVAISDTSASALTDQIESRAREFAASLHSSDEVSPLRRRLLIVATIAAELRITLSHPVLWQVLDRLMPAGKSDGMNQRNTAEAGTEKSPKRFEVKAPEAEVAEKFRAPSPASVTASSLVESSEWDVRINCALPFLLLGPLIQMGYLTALAAVLEATGLEAEAPIFAAALAYKVLDAPARGWQRTPASQLAAAVFAGSREPFEEELLVEFSRKIGSHTSALDITLADALITGHTANSPVLLCRADLSGSKSWLLVDTPGCFPIACCDQSEDILPLLDRLGRPIVLVSQDAAEAALLADLNAAGVNFISQLPPTRNERWRRIQQGSSTLGWTNSQNGDLELLQRAARELDAATGEAQALWQTLAISRAGVVNTCSSAFERSLTLAAAVALGTISWQLWQTRGRTSPQQALEGYHDFDAHVRFAPDSVVVRLPLGRRRSSLYEVGLLAPLSDIPWFGDRRFGDRRVEYEGG
jgi:hypothetical protein